MKAPISETDLEALCQRLMDKGEVGCVVASAVKDPDLTGVLVELLHSNAKMVCQSASWPLISIAANHPHLIEPFLERLVSTLERPINDTVVRNILRIFEEMDVAEEYEGRLFDVAFSFLLDPKSAIAIKAFSMTVCFKIACKYPELIPELQTVLQELIPTGSAGVRARARQVLQNIAKIKG